MMDNEIHGVTLHQITGIDSLEENVITQDEKDFLLQTFIYNPCLHMLRFTISEAMHGKINLPIKSEVKQAEHTSK